MKYLFAATSVVLLTLAFVAPAPLSAAEEESAASQAIVAVADAQERTTRETQTPKRTRLKPMRLNAKKTKLYLNASAKAPRYTCDSEEGECTCSGINDCLKLAGSGDCKGGHMWEDGTDPSKGGCDIGG
jgi:hypothetical protein